MRYPQNIDVYQRYPEQFTTALSKIGGLLALFKIASLAMKEYHRRSFEKMFLQPARYRPCSIQDTENLIEANAVSFKELFTYQNLFETLKQTANREQASDVRDDIETLKSAIDEL